MRRKHLKPIEFGEGLQIAVAGARDRRECEKRNKEIVWCRFGQLPTESRRERFSGLPQKICLAKILWEEERSAVKRVKARLRTFTAERLRRDESRERSSKMRRYVRS